MPAQVDYFPHPDYKLTDTDTFATTTISWYPPQITNAATAEEIAKAITERTTERPRATSLLIDSGMEVFLAAISDAALCEEMRRRGFMVVSELGFGREAASRGYVKKPLDMTESRCPTVALAASPVEALRCACGGYVYLDENGTRYYRPTDSTSEFEWAKTASCPGCGGTATDDGLVFTDA